MQCFRFQRARIPVSVGHGKLHNLVQIALLHALRKKGHAITADKFDGVTRYQIAAAVIIHADRIEASIDPQALGKRLGIEDPDSQDQRIDVAVPTVVVRRGGDAKLTIRFDAPTMLARRDPNLLGLIVKAHEARRTLGLDGKPRTVAPDLEYQQRNHLARLARLSFLAPDITSAILDGAQPANLSARRLLRVPDLPLDSMQQREMLGLS